jgi:hypothetical protein
MNMISLLQSNKCLVCRCTQSGGDWALQRTAALWFQGTEGLSVESCIMQRLDGNALMLSGYNRHAHIVNNTFTYTGASTIALWGSTSGTHPNQPPGTGPDGTGGDFPRYTVIEGNFMRRLGIHEKQSSCASLALSPLPVILSYKAEKSLCGAGACSRPSQRRQRSAVTCALISHAPVRNIFVLNPTFSIFHRAH